MRACDDNREKLLAQLIEEHAPVPTAEDVLRQARIAHGSTMHFHIGSLRAPQPKQSLVRLQYTTGGVVATAQSAAADRVAADAKEGKALAAAAAAAAAAQAPNGAMVVNASPGGAAGEDGADLDESATLLVRELPKQITIKPQPRFGSLALSGSMINGAAAAAATMAQGYPHRSPSSASSGGKEGAGGGGGGGGSGEAGGGQGPSNRWHVGAVPMRFNWDGDGADGDAAAAAAKAAAAAAAAAKLCGVPLPEDPPQPPSAATLAAARAEQALRLQHQRRARRMSAADVPSGYQAQMAAVAAAGAPVGCSSDGTGGLGPEDSEAPLPSRFQMHLAQLLGPAEGDATSGSAAPAAVAAAGSPRAGARRSIDAAARPRGMSQGAAAAGPQFPPPSRGLGSSGAVAGEDGMAPPSPSGGSATAQRLMQPRTPLQQQVHMQMHMHHRHSTGGGPPGAGGALRPTPLSAQPGALSTGQLNYAGTEDPASGGPAAAAAAAAAAVGGGPADPAAAAALARLARVTRTQAARPEPQQIWAVDSTTAAALTHGADSAFGSGYSYSVYGRGIPGLPVRGISGDGDGGGGGGALRARGSGQQAPPAAATAAAVAATAEEEDVAAATARGDAPEIAADGTAASSGAGGDVVGSRGGSMCGTPAAAAAPAEAQAESGAGLADGPGAAGDVRSSPLATLASPPPAPRPPRQLPMLSVPGAPRMSSGGSAVASPASGTLPSPGAAASPVPGFLGMRGSMNSPAGRQRRTSLSIPDSAALVVPPSPSAGVAGIASSGSSFTPRPPASPLPAGGVGGGASAPLPSALSRAGASVPGGLSAAAASGGRSPAAAASPARVLPTARSVPMAGQGAAAMGSFSGGPGMEEARQGLFSRGAAASGGLPVPPSLASPPSTSSPPAPDSPSGAVRRQRFAKLPPPTASAARANGGTEVGSGGGGGVGGDAGTGSAGAATGDDPERAGIMAKMKKALSFLRRGAE